MGYYWQFGVVWDYRQVFVEGLLATVALALACIAASTVLGVLLAVARTSENKTVERTTKAACLLFRAFPVLILIVWLYYCLPVLFGISLSAFEAAFLGITLSDAAYIAEDVRAGIESIPRGQKEAAKNAGLDWLQINRFIVLPQALRNISPVLVNEYVTITKFTSLASVIGVQELLHKGGNLISVTYRPLEVYTAVAAGYLAVVLPLMLLEGRLKPVKRK